MNLFETYVDSGLTFARKKCTQAMQQVECRVVVVVVVVVV